MAHLLAGLGLVVAFAFAILGLAVYVWRPGIPRWFRVSLWAVPLAPFVMLACLIALVLTHPGANS